jgi:hypothetical protein
MAALILDCHPVVGTPADPDSLAPELGSGDKLHPNVAG